jgi:hypothetical protein
LSSSRAHCLILHFSLSLSLSLYSSCPFSTTHFANLLNARSFLPLPSPGLCGRRHVRRAQARRPRAVQPRRR